LTVAPHKRDFGTLRTEQIAYAGLAELEAAPSEPETAKTLAYLILQIFRDYADRARKIPWLAKRAFETRDWPASLDLSRERIAIYALAIAKTAPILQLVIRAHDRSSSFWRMVEEHYGGLIQGRYDADLALAFLASIRRAAYRHAWTPVAYHVDYRTPAESSSGFLKTVEAPGVMTETLARTIFAAPGLEAAFRDAESDAAAITSRINDELGLDEARSLVAIEVVEAGFYRNRGAYIVGALMLGEERNPFALALLHGADGVYVDAVILRETTLRHVFSSTLANFHVTVTAYHELADYLFALMPTRPQGMHYSTIGYNHVGKLAVMEQIMRHREEPAERLSHAPGPRGSVAIGMTSPARQYVMKVIRDEPTESYKWERFDGVDAVLGKYRQVHELNRSGSMLDNIIYSNIAIPRAMFEDELLDDLLKEAPNSISLDRDAVFFSHLIVQRKLIPVPLYLAECTPEAAEMVVIRLGQCIRNNAATNVFNRDLDGRNYGVSTLRFVYLFDYDAIESLTGVKVRTNVDREAGEEDIPDWFFEEGTVFLPEELELHLRLPDRKLARLFHEAHGELLTADYWWRMQRRLEDGSVPRVRTYPRSCELRRT
jgi:isocitrate dehydrogenase kinase/phosphatase